MSKFENIDKENELNEEMQKEIYEKIEASAENIDVPKSLEPENIKVKLREKKRKLPLRRTTEIAAAIALVCIVGGAGIYGAIEKNIDYRKTDLTTSGNSDTISANLREISNDGKDSVVKRNIPVEKTKIVGDYRLASDYDEVYQVIKKQKEKSYSVNDLADGFVSGAIFNDGNVKLEDADMGATSDTVYQEAAEEDRVDDKEASKSDYSTTNLMVEGVDESDFIKNDGNYLYVQTDNKVSVIDIRSNDMESVAALQPKMGASDSICDMYVDENQLYIILQKRETELNSDKKNVKQNIVEDLVDVVYEDVYYENADTCMELQTYDISDRKNIKYLGTVKQDGSYYSSRKVGDYIYLFSREYLHEEEIPSINGELAKSDCIYIQDNVSSELIVSSVYVNEPDKVVDHLVLMNQYAQIYMSTEAIYLYSEQYDWNEATYESKSYTDIAKFSYKDGILNGVAATSVIGTIQDVFAISESNGILRVLTTEWKEASTNQLYLLDEKLNLLGSLKDIAVGEEIYAARYIGDIVYFITYHNTDPLFAVDISNPSAPKMLGQVEITGFSDYLHPYGDGLLLGIGYETDPDTSECLGVKLVMFDVSDPTSLNILDSVTFEGDYCSAASFYKSALVSTSRNLIGFEVTDWGKDSGILMRYLMYSWDGENFVKEFSEKIDNDVCWDESTIRGLYAGDRFYLVRQENGGYRIGSYDMKDDYKMLDELIVE